MAGQNVKKSTQKKLTQKRETLVHPDMIINDVVGLFPEAAEIMLSYGLHCIGCGASGFETIYEGMVGHGYPEEDMRKMIDELNKFAAELTKGGRRTRSGPGTRASLTMTPKAQSKVIAIAEHEGKNDWGIKLQAFRSGCCDVKYAMDFVERPGLTDKVIGVAKGVTVIVPQDQWELLAGSEIDYVERVDASGFKVNNPNKKPCGCSGSDTAEKADHS